MSSGIYLEGVVFISSFIFCVLPKLFTQINMLKKMYPFLTLLAAGFMLAVQLLDFIPHMIVRHDHSHDHHGSHDHHSHEHHHSHEKDDHFYSQIGFLVSGISFIFLLGIDSIVLKHNHCEEKQNESSECCNNNHNPSFHEKKTEEIHQREGSHRSHSHPKHSNDQLGCCNTDLIKNSNSKAQAFIYILSISIHSFFEGLAFKNTDEIGNFEVGILLHKVLESFSIGLTLFSSNFSIWMALLLTGFYSFLTPLGMFIGNRYSGQDVSVKGIPLFYIFNGLALGSLMFIVCVEMIPSSFHKPGNSKLKIAVLTLGYLLTSIFIITTHG